MTTKQLILLLELSCRLLDGVATLTTQKDYRKLEREGLVKKNIHGIYRCTPNGRNHIAAIKQHASCLHRHINKT